MEHKLTFYKIYHHWKTIKLHRKWVRHYCFLAGIPWRGIIHDLSKYSPMEFLESARYYQGNSSPIPVIKQDLGYSKAWLHHKGRNPHHYEYWADNFDRGCNIITMPEKDFTELVCDYLGAARAYMGDTFSYSAEMRWWLNKRPNCAMPEDNKKMLDIIFQDLEYADNHIMKGCPTALLTSTPESLIKSGYIQEVWRSVIYHNIA